MCLRVCVCLRVYFICSCVCVMCVTCTCVLCCVYVLMERFSVSKLCQESLPLGRRKCCSFFIGPYYHKASLNIMAVAMTHKRS